MANIYHHEYTLLRKVPYYEHITSVFLDMKKFTWNHITIYTNICIKGT